MTTLGRLSSAKPFLALLQETEPELLGFALKNLERYCDEFWFEMAREVAQLVEVAEADNLMPELRQRAALVASQVYFHMGRLSDSVRYALSAGALLDVTKRTEYTDTIVGACVDLYVSLREKEAARREREEAEQSGRRSGSLPASAAAGEESLMQRYASTTASTYEGSPEVDARVAEVFERLATTWNDSSYAAAKEMVGFCLRARRTDLLMALLRRAQLVGVSQPPSSSTSGGGGCSGAPTSGCAALVSHAVQVSMEYVKDMRFRAEAVRALADLYAERRTAAAVLDEQVFLQMQCLTFLEDTATVARVLHSLVAAAAAGQADKANHSMAYAMQLAFDIYESSNQDLLQRIIKELEALIAPAAPAAGASDGAAASAAAAAAVPEAGGFEAARVRDLISILNGSVTTDLYLKFLFSRCKADTPMFTKMKKLVPVKASVLVSAVMTSGCLSYSGTAHDSFLRDNIPILQRLTDWARYTAAATLGVVHRGHTSQIMELLKPYLPNRQNVSPLPYQEAGALFALGLATCGSNLQSGETVAYLKQALTDYSHSEQLVHGASMGLGLAALGLHDEALSDQLFTSVAGGEAVGSEGAALAIGLNMLGAADEALCQQLLNAARERNQKEKTIRGLVMGIALIMMRRESLALSVIDEMAADLDPWIRVGACYVLGLAYAATDSTLAIEKLLKLCVSDAHEEVRRAAIMMIGFVTLANVKHCVAMVRPFTDNYSAHVRYGVAMALAVASAGVPDPAVLRLLKRLDGDAVSFVRQGAIIAQSLVLIQATEQQTTQVKDFRQRIWKVISDQKADTCTKFGCILAAGLIDAGGRNCTIALHRGGAALLRPIVGMFLFSQHWHWFPHILPICLAMQPTTVIGLNENMRIPEIGLVSRAPPEQFAPPPTMLEEKAKDPKAGEKKLATLSATTMQEQRKAEKKKNAVAGVAANQDGAATAAAATAADGAKKEGDAAAAAAAAVPEKKTEELLQNPARVTKAQLSVVELQEKQRYRPLRGKLTLGINVMVDNTPEAGEDTKLFVVDFAQRSDDVKPPEPFAWP